MTYPRQKRGTCGHIMALCDAHSKCARCWEKELGTHNCVEEEKGAPEEGKLFLPPPPPPLIDPYDVTVLGKVESGKGDRSDRGKDPPSKKK